jgi:hypothetical protein
MTSVAKTFAKRPLRRRIIALVAAYAIAFAGLIAGFVAAQAAAESAAQADLVICHSSVADQQAPASNQTDAQICADCCIGCLTPMPVAVPPSAPAVVVPQVLAAWLAPLAHSSSLPAIASKAHRSRGPPPAL